MPATKVHQTVDIGPGKAGRIVQTVNVGGDSPSVILATFRVTAADLIGSTDAFVELMPAAGPGTLIAVVGDGVMVYHAGTTGFQNVATMKFYTSKDDFAYWKQYADASTALGGTTDTVIFFAPYEDTASADLAAMVNQPLYLYTGSNTMSDGDGYLDVTAPIAILEV